MHTFHSPKYLRRLLRPYTHCRMHKHTRGHPLYRGLVTHSCTLLIRRLMAETMPYIPAFRVEIHAARVRRVVTMLAEDLGAPCRRGALRRLRAGIGACRRLAHVAARQLSQTDWEWRDGAARASVAAASATTRFLAATPLAASPAATPATTRGSSLRWLLPLCHLNRAAGQIAAVPLAASIVPPYRVAANETRGGPLCAVCRPLGGADALSACCAAAGCVGCVGCSSRRARRWSSACKRVGNRRRGANERESKSKRER